MKIGLVFPQTEIGTDPALIRDYAQAAEDLGFTHILAYDHILGANPHRPGGWQGPYTHQDAFHEPFVLYSFMAAVTERIEFVTGILILPQRETAVVAKQAATLDSLSNGRLRLGVGIGWNAVEYTALNQDFHTRGRRIEEQVILLRRLWTEPLVTFEERWHHIPDAGLNPLPIQRPIPIWFGGHADAVLRRTARLGDGWMPGFRTAADAASALATLESYLAEYGRSRADCGLEPRIHLRHGDLDMLVKRAQDWRAAGATHLSFNTMDAGLKSPAAHIHAIEAFAAAVSSEL
ncbi:MAG: LLM class F420-dependent oxidoreductase [Candidatus Promineifilaceae bacterium]|nr:LLM class F420-dependent oxidoreductase [Candidatus Promineifilaceae bacterium]